jgi:flagellar motor switch protein FliG
MTVHANTQGIRRAAVFVASLDQRTADILLDRMTADESRMVRDMLMNLESIDDEERQSAIDEFYRASPASQATLGVELDGRLAASLGLSRFGGKVALEESDAEQSPPFQFLHDAEAEKLVKVLSAERPQVIALVLSHLPQKQAGGVLIRLSPSLQVDVLRRLVDLEETDQEILREVERGLQSRLSEQLGMQRRRVAGLSAVAGILAASDQRIGMKLMENLAARDRQLADRLSPGRFEFKDLFRLADADLATLVQAVNAELVVISLVGAPAAWVDRFLRHFPEAQAAAIRRRLEHFGPIRLSDVEEARGRMAQFAKRLTATGKIGPPHSRAA